MFPHSCLTLLHNFEVLWGVDWSFCMVLCGGDFFSVALMDLLCLHLCSLTWEFWPGLCLQCVTAVCPKPSKLEDLSHTGCICSTSRDLEGYGSSDSVLYLSPPWQSCHGVQVLQINTCC